jgi:hypothetical protein
MDKAESGVRDDSRQVVAVISRERRMSQARPRWRFSASMGGARGVTMPPRRERNDRQRPVAHRPESVSQFAVVERSETGDVGSDVTRAKPTRLTIHNGPSAGFAVRINLGIGR